MLDSQRTIEAEGEVPTEKVSAEKSQEDFKAGRPAGAVKGNARLPAVDTDAHNASVGDLPGVELRRKVDITGKTAERVSVEKCQETEGSTYLYLASPPVSPDASAEGKRKSGLGVFGGIFGKKDKKKEEKKSHEPSADMKLAVQADDEQTEVNIPDVSNNIHTDIKQEGVPLSPTEDNEQPALELTIPSSNVEIKHESTDGKSLEPTVGVRDLEVVDIDMPEVQLTSRSAVHAKTPELSKNQDEIGLSLHLDADGTHGGSQSPDVDAGVEPKSWDIDVNANKIFDKDADVTLDGAGKGVSGGIADSAQLEVTKPEVSAAVLSTPTETDFDADVAVFSVEAPQVQAPRVPIDEKTCLLYTSPSPRDS